MSKSSSIHVELANPGSSRVAGHGPDSPAPLDERAHQADTEAAARQKAAQNTTSKSKSKKKKKAVPDDLPDDVEVELGHHNWAKGIVEDEILAPGEAAYADAVRSGNRAAVRAFLQTKTSQYIFQVGWRTSMKAKPIGPLPLWNDTCVLPDEPGLTDSEERAKAWIIEQMRERIERWYTYRYETTHGKGVKVGNAEDPYSVFFTELAGITPAKKCRQGFQQYMTESHGKPAPAHFRAKVARELFNNLDAGTQASIKARAKLAAQRDREEYAARLRSWPDRSPEGVQRAIDNLPGVMHRLMQGISDATGLHMSIGQNHAAVPSSFPQWRRKHFNEQVLGLFKEYLETAYTPAQRLAMALPEGSESMLDHPDLLSMDDDASPAPAAPAAPALPSKTSKKSSKKATSKAVISTDDDKDGDAEDEEASRRAKEEEEAYRRAKAYEAMRLANIARNKALLAELDILHAAKHLGPEPVATAKLRKPRQPKAPSNGSGPVRRSPRNGGHTSGETVDAPSETEDAVMVDADVAATDDDMGVIPLDGNSDTDLIDIDSIPNLDTSINTDTDTSVQVTVTTTTTGPVIDTRNDMDVDVPECPDDAPEWVRKVYAEFSGTNLGPNYNAVVEAFFGLQGAFGWVNGSGTLPTDHRPKQIGAWVKNRRIAKPAFCDIPNTAVYAREWWLWWTGMQPDWRGTMDERPGDGEAHGQSWDGLYVSGVNGLVNVVVSLYWWGCTEKALGCGYSADWIRATKDVEWVFKGIQETVVADLS
ncbi:hypothetical protein C8F01DRAFT_1255031 [Mycena amicta]|nr:hypothetical protein C8F01DRAFT_1255031 [Mycena amicta]